MLVISVAFCLLFLAELELGGDLFFVRRGAAERCGCSIRASVRKFTAAASHAQDLGHPQHRSESLERAIGYR